MFFKYSKWLNSSIIGTLTGTTTPSLRRPGSYGIEDVLHIP